MDAVDLALLRTLLREPRASYERLGDAVGLSPNAAKGRLARMTADGVVQGVLAAPAAQTLGLREGLLVFSGVDDLDEREEDLLHNLCELPGVRFADAGIDGTVALWLYVRDEADAERIERAAISLVGKPPAWRRVCAPVPGAILSATEWRAARALLVDGRARLRDAAAEARVAPKTFKRRIDAMLSSRRLRLAPVLSSAESAAPLLEVVLVLAPDADRAALRAALPPDALLADGMADTLLAWIPARHLSAARRVAGSLRHLPGVERVLALVSTRRAGTTWMDEVAQRALAPVPLPVPMPVPKSR
jgi:DNA-binding Lrp family transcriptional regulator